MLGEFGFDEGEEALDRGQAFGSFVGDVDAEGALDFHDHFDHVEAVGSDGAEFEFRLDVVLIDAELLDEDGAELLADLIRGLIRGLGAPTIKTLSGALRTR